MTRSYKQQLKGSAPRQRPASQLWPLVGSALKCDSLNELGSSSTRPSLAGPAAEELFCGTITDGGDLADCEMAREHLSRSISNPLQVAAELARCRAAAARLVRSAWAQQRIRLLFRLAEAVEDDFRAGCGQGPGYAQSIPLVDPVTSDTLPASAPPLRIFSGLMAMFIACPPVLRRMSFLSC
jgi:hypothetical protein